MTKIERRREQERVARNYGDVAKPYRVRNHKRLSQKQVYNALKLPPNASIQKILDTIR